MNGAPSFQPIDWPGLLRACAMAGVPPHQAWSLSLMEWRALTGQRVAEGLSAPDLTALMAQFPDTKISHKDATHGQYI